MRILPVISRLQSECPLLTRVESAKSLLALGDDEIANDLPVAFVYSGKETSSTNEMINITRQRGARIISVMIAAGNIDAGSEPLEDVRDQIKSALIGWVPATNFEPIEYVEGELVDLSARVVWWRDNYVTFNYDRG